MLVLPFDLGDAARSTRASAIDAASSALIPGPAVPGTAGSAGAGTDVLVDVVRSGAGAETTGTTSAGTRDGGVLARARPVPAASSMVMPAAVTTAEPPTSDAGPAPVGSTEVITSPGGTVLARCTAGAVEVVSSCPAQGWWLDDEQERTRVRFETDETDVDLRLSCRDGVAVGTVEIDDRAQGAATRP